MGGNSSREERKAILACVDALEEELTLPTYDLGVTPVSVVQCIRSLTATVRDGYGHVIVPKAMYEEYNRDVVIPYSVAAASKASSRSAVALAYTKPVGSSATYKSVTLRSSPRTPAQARKDRAERKKQEAERRRSSLTSATGAMYLEDRANTIDAEESIIELAPRPLKFSVKSPSSGHSVAHEPAVESSMSPAVVSAPDFPLRRTDIGVDTREPRRHNSNDDNASPPQDLSKTYRQRNHETFRAAPAQRYVSDMTSRFRT